METQSNRLLEQMSLVELICGDVKEISKLRERAWLDVASTENPIWEFPFLAGPIYPLNESNWFQFQIVYDFSRRIQMDSKLKASLHIEKIQ